MSSREHCRAWAHEEIEKGLKGNVVRGHLRARTHDLPADIASLKATHLLYLHCSICTSTR
eukprot:753234-Pelagomonas_calceolata.AAC.6